MPGVKFTGTNPEQFDKLISPPVINDRKQVYTVMK